LNIYINPLFEELSDNHIPTKTCRRCNEVKHKKLFAHRSYNKNGEAEYKNYCIECDKKSSKQVALIKKQIGAVPDNHLCDCCKRSEKDILNAYKLFQGTMKKTVWTYDHDHKTGKFRGIICQPCNSIMGNLQDNEDIAIKVLSYVRKQL
tara:strand:+ start:780 stop:1226 length:447 start_codon:yes stop_codon:yes gene_type:complete